VKYAVFNGTINVFIPDEYDTIGIAMSGGLDSTLLANLVLPFVDQSKVTVFTVEQKNNVKTVKRILAECGFKVKDHIVLQDPKLDNGALSPTMVTISTTVDYFYTGTNKNPPWADSIHPSKKPNRANMIKYNNMMMPFGLIEKTDILYLLQASNLMHLLPYTHTCTERPQGTKSCGTCFACRERKWAFDTLKLTDIVDYEA
jgi:7-cyano-7-deazaguanine synthase in queuosine biosynthesis